MNRVGRIDMLGVLRDLMDGVSEYCRLRDGLKSGARRLAVDAPAQAAAFTLGTLWRDVDAPMLVVAPRPEDARRLHEQLVAWCRVHPRRVLFRKACPFLVDAE